MVTTERSRRPRPSLIVVILVTSLDTIIVDTSVDGKQARSRIAVELIPPHADQVLLVENCTIRTDKIVSFVIGADVEDLTLGFDVSVVPRPLLLITSEGRFEDFGVDGVVLAGGAGNGGVVAIAVATVVVVLVSREARLRADGGWEIGGCSGEVSYLGSLVSECG